MSRYSHALMVLALPCLILAPWVELEARFAVWAVGSATAICAALFHLSND